MRLLRSIAPAAFALALGACARMPAEAHVPELRATLLSAAMLAEMGTLPAGDPGAPVSTPEQAWAGFRRAYPDKVSDCDAWAHIDDWFVFSIRPAERNQEAGFKDIAYVKQGGSQFRFFSPGL